MKLYKRGSIRLLQVTHRWYWREATSSQWYRCLNDPCLTGFTRTPVPRGCFQKPAIVEPWSTLIVKQHGSDQATMTSVGQTLLREVGGQWREVQYLKEYDLDWQTVILDRWELL